MVWTHNERYMLSVDDGGRVKYWRTNYELLKDEAAHQDAVCGVTVAPSDAKFATCSKDGTLKVPEALLQPCIEACMALVDGHLLVWIFACWLAGVGLCHLRGGACHDRPRR